MHEKGRSTTLSKMGTFYIPELNSLLRLSYQDKFFFPTDHKGTVHPQWKI